MAFVELGRERKDVTDWFPEGEMWPGTESNCRHEDFQSSDSTETMSLLVVN
jgi:hypothetical protein